MGTNWLDELARLDAVARDESLPQAERVLAGNNAWHLAGSHRADILAMRDALRAFACSEMERADGPADTQYVWSMIYNDRVQDWFSFEDFEAARQALGESL